MNVDAYLQRIGYSGPRTPDAATLAALIPLSQVHFALAENAVAPNNGDGFDTHLFRPAMDSKGFFTTNGTDILGKDDFSVGLVLDYGRTLLRVDGSQGNPDKLIPHSFQGTLAVNYGLFNRASIAVSDFVSAGARRASTAPMPMAAVPSPATRSDAGSSAKGRPLRTMFDAPAGRSTSITRVTRAASG